MQIKYKFLLLALFGFLNSNSQITITLRKTFIDSFKNKLTIAADYEIYFAHKRPNPGDKDGDLHFAGFDKKIGVPIVAEIMNAKEFENAVEKVHLFEGKGKPQNKVKLTGVWRLWCEHPGDIDDFVQGKFTQKILGETIQNTNPPHVYEIHPITKIDTIDVLGSFHKISGFTYKIASDAFERYSNLRCKIKPKAKTITIETSGIGYNYVDFWIQLNDTSKAFATDGLFVFCSIFDSDFQPEPDDDGQDHLISHKLRVAFVKGTDLYDKIKGMTKGDFLHVLGIPRINLALISWRAANSKTRPEALQWNLPYEMVAVGELQ
jgi:hypothetical protein